MDQQQIADPYSQQQVPVTSDEMYATQMQEDKIKNVLGQTSPDNQLVELQWRLKGYIFDRLTQDWKKIEKNVKEPDPTMVAKYVSFAASILNDNTRFSTLGREEINNIMTLSIEWVVDDMDVHAEEYGIAKNYTERTRICAMLMNFIFTILKRSQDGGEAKRIWGSLSLNENQNPMQAMSKKQQFGEATRDWRI